MEKHDKNINRRDFLKIAGVTAATTAAALHGCTPRRNGNNARTDVPKGQMTTRALGKDTVSILGYGCMRWPTVTKGSARDNDDDIDQETVNRLVDYAIEHGVNYFDTPTARDGRNTPRAWH